MGPVGHPELEFSRSVQNISESATLAMDRRAREMASAGESVISFAAGEPDLPTPEFVVEAAAAACRDSAMHHYTPAAGLPELRRAIAAKTLRDARTEVGADQVLVTSGTKQALAHAFTTLLNPGDEVLVPTPYWVTFPELIRLAGGVPVEVPTGEEGGFKVTPAQLEGYLSPKTKALLFVSPSNPTGAMYTEAQMTSVGQFCLERGLWVVSDEIYEHFSYGRVQFRSLPSLVPELAEQVIRVNGVSKSYAMTGWRVGWMVASPKFVAAASNLQSHVCGNISNVSQRAALAALESGLDSVVAMRESFAKRRSAILAHLDRLPGFECPPPDGAFYVFPSVTGLMGRRLGDLEIQSSAQLADILLEQAKVAVVPGEAFGAPGHLRFSYALADDQLDQGMSRIAALLS